jgi:hypothetical protein
MRARTQYDDTQLESLTEATAWSVKILTRLIEVGKLDRYDKATVKAVIGALDPRLNPRLRPLVTKVTARSSRRSQRVQRKEAPEL